MLRPSGGVFAAGAGGPNSVYSTAKAAWSVAPSFPVLAGKQYDVADGPAAVLPDGNVLVMASPGIYETPSHFFVFNGATLTQVADCPNAANLSSFYGFMLVLPTGQIMFNTRFGDVELYTDSGLPGSGWAPDITSVPTSLVAGGKYLLYGTQLSGLTQGAAYGDDYQSATNYPLVRLTNAKTKHVFYARTSGESSMSVAPGKFSSVYFQLPAASETGSASLVVVTNGIASLPVTVTVSAPKS